MSNKNNNKIFAVCLGCDSGFIIEDMPTDKPWHWFRCKCGVGKYYLTCNPPNSVTIVSSKENIGMMRIDELKPVGIIF